MTKIKILIVAAAILLYGCSKKASVAAPTEHFVYISDYTYQTVVIGSQTWTAVNYNGPGGEAYENGIDTVAQGKLYTMAEAAAVPLPSGWRVPTANDFTNLITSIGIPPTDAPNGPPILSLMSTTGWFNGNGNNTSGFNALPLGYYGEGYGGVQSFQWKATHAVFISYSTDGNTPSCLDIFRYAAPNDEQADLDYYVVLPTDRASLRFVKDN